MEKINEVSFKSDYQLFYILKNMLDILEVGVAIMLVILVIMVYRYNSIFTNSI